MTPESIPAHAGFRGGPLGQAYNEKAFRYFLAIDRCRLDGSQRSMIVVLASVRQSPGRNAHLPNAAAAAIFASLAASIREVDYVGWYREGRIAGAVLAQGVAASGELRDVIAKRILAALTESRPAGHARHVQLRVVRLGRKADR